MRAISKVFGALLAGAALAGGPGWAQGPAPGAGFESVVDRAIATENALNGILRGTRPVAETYIQEMEKDSDFGAVPKTDHYFLNIGFRHRAG
ncbi:MAG: hypothetical protein ABUS51_03855, partial [Acidobacteriota bacterium]